MRSMAILSVFISEKKWDKKKVLDKRTKKCYGKFSYFMA
jgi:hypothetical protein